MIDTFTTILYEMNEVAAVYGQFSKENFHQHICPTPAHERTSVERIYITIETNHKSINRYGRQQKAKNVLRPRF